MTRVLLINMPFCEQEYTRFAKKWTFVEDEYIGINIVHALLERGGWDVVRGLTTDLPSLVGQTLDVNPAYVMLSVMQTSARAAREFVIRLREAGYGGKVFVGGWYAKLSWRRIFEEKWPVDYVCYTDAEEVLPQWMSAPDVRHVGIATCADFDLNEESSRQVREANRWPENFIRPKREAGRNTYRLETSRGCPHSKCTFCSLSCANVIRNKWMPVPADRILDEMRALHDEYGATRFSLTDDDMLGPIAGAEERARAICSAFLSLPFKVRFSGSVSVRAATNGRILDLLVQCGLEQLGIGFESADEDQLRRYCKAQTLKENFQAADNIVSRRIRLIPGLITFDPFVTREAVAKNLDFLFETLHHYDLGKLTKRLHVIDGTPMEKMTSDAGLLSGSGRELEYRFLHAETQALYMDFKAYTEHVREIQIAVNLLGDEVSRAAGRFHAVAARRILDGADWRSCAAESERAMKKMLEGNR